jgi:hypothetical protein
MTRELPVNISCLNDAHEHRVVLRVPIDTASPERGSLELVNFLQTSSFYFILNCIAGSRKQFWHVIS